MFYLADEPRQLADKLHHPSAWYGKVQGKGKEKSWKAVTLTWKMQVWRWLYRCICYFSFRET